MKTLTRGKLARAAGVGAETIRFYEQRGLLRRPPRTAAGYRRFDDESLQRLRFIRRAKDLGFNLHEIGELLALHDAPGGERAAVKALAGTRLAEIEARIRDLERMRAVLAQLETECSGTGPINGCPIIHALAGDSPPVTVLMEDNDDAQPAAGEPTHGRG